MRKITLAVALILLGIKPVLADPPSKDILGIQLGASTDDIMSKVADLNRGYEVRHLQTYGFIVGLDAIKMGPTGRLIDEQLVVLFSDNNTIELIGRAQRLNEDKELDPDVLVTSLVEKYGPSTVREGTLIQWAFDRDGNLLDTMKPCQPEPGRYDRPTTTRSGVGQDLSSIQGLRMYAQKKLMPDCGMIFDVHWTTSSKSGLVNMMSVVLVDVATQFDAAQAAEAKREQKRLEEEAARQKRIEEAKSIKPEL